jgi:hypothetical protein
MEQNLKNYWYIETMKDKKDEPKLSFIFVVLLILINFPLLSLAIKQGSFWGIPVQVLYVFLVWFFKM